MRIALWALVLTLFFGMSSAAHAAVIDVPPGGNLTTAYNNAASGDTLRLSTGSYGTWTTPGGSKTITIKAAAGTKPVFRQLANAADNTTFDGIHVDAGGRPPNINMAAFETGGRSNVTFKNGSIGNVIDQKGGMFGGDASPASKRVVIDNVWFHDVVATNSSIHNECLMTHTPGITIRNSTFTDCAAMAISLGRGDWWGQPQYGNVTLENNVIAHSENTNSSGWHYYGLAWWLDNLDNARVVNNTFENAVIMDRAVRGTNGVWANNVGGGWACNVPGVTYANNVGQKCGLTDKAVSPASSCGPPACGSNVTAPYGWVNPAVYDFRLKFGSPAIDAGSATYAPATDKDGNARVGAPDAGAYEYAAATPSPTPSPTPTATPSPTATPTPSPTPSPTPEPTYDPDCAPTCDEQISALKAKIQAARDALGD